MSQGKVRFMPIPIDPAAGETRRLFQAARTRRQLLGYAARALLICTAGRTAFTSFESDPLAWFLRVCLTRAAPRFAPV